jgi:hypothetical protein
MGTLKIWKDLSSVSKRQLAEGNSQSTVRKIQIVIK